MAWKRCSANRHECPGAGRSGRGRTKRPPRYHHVEAAGHTTAPVVDLDPQGHWRPNRGRDDRWMQGEIANLRLPPNPKTKEWIMNVNTGDSIIWDKFGARATLFPTWLV